MPPRDHSTTPSTARPLRQIRQLPGPASLPLLGNTRQLTLSRIHRDMEDWARQYGPFMRVWFGRIPVLVVADSEAVAAVLRDRPDGFRRPLSSYTVSVEMGGAPGLFLAGFLFLLMLYWSTFRTQVPYYPSGKAAWDAVAEHLPQDKPVSFIDIGSGLGGLVLDLASRRADIQATGIELAPLPWLASWLRAKLTNSHATFLRGDYERLDFAQYDAVFAYLSPAAMTALWRKAKKEMRPGSMLMSYEFAISESTPTLSVYLPNTGRTLYIWHF